LNLFQFRDLNEEIFESFGATFSLDCFDVRVCLEALLSAEADGTFNLDLLDGPAANDGLAEDGFVETFFSVDLLGSPAADETLLGPFDRFDLFEVLDSILVRS